MAQVVRSGAGTRGGKHGRNAADLSLRLGALEGCERGNNVAGLQPQQVRHDTPGAAGAAIGDRVVVPLLHPGRWPGVHVNLITAIQELLNRQIRPKYFARVEDRTARRGALRLDGQPWQSGFA